MSSSQKPISRRGFLSTAALAPGVTAAQSTPPPRRAVFSRGDPPVRISENLYLLQDTCNVYLIREGSAAWLIDFGSGKILDLLPQLGVNRVHGVLFTHHHRDQCQGAALAVERGIPLFVPAHERHLFEDAENFWRNRRIFHLYTVRNDFFTLTENVSVAGALEDYTEFDLAGRRFFVLPTPGHTVGSVTLLCPVDGKRVAFSGDLIHSPGKVHTLYDMQLEYGQAEGFDLAVHSLAQLDEHKPELLCPSHGEPLPDPATGMRETARRLADFYRFYTGVDLTTEHQPFAVSPHLVASRGTVSTFYAIISDSGKALFVDYGSASSNAFRSFLNYAPVHQRIRFVEHTVAALRERFGLKSIDIAMPSHMHDDHLNGFPYLQQKFGTKVWCYQNMVDILEHPRGRNLGCILGEPIRVERSFRHGETFRWEEFEFTVTHSPGHTEYQMAMFADIDGQRVAFTGDAFFDQPSHPAVQDGSLRHNLIFRNHVENDSHLKSLRNILDHEPKLIAPGHGQPYALTPVHLRLTEARLKNQARAFDALVADPETNFGMNPSWVKVYPYQMEIKDGGSLEGELQVRNYRSEEMTLSANLALPDGWRCEPSVIELRVPAKSDASADFRLMAPSHGIEHPQRRAIAVDIMADQKYLGQITEAVVDVYPQGS